MPNSPVLYGPNNVAVNLQSNEQLGNGHILSYNGPKNYILESTYKNGPAPAFTWSLGTIGTLTNSLPTGTPNFSGTTTGLTLGTGAALSPSTGLTCISLTCTTTTTVGNMFASPAITLDSSTQGKVLTFAFNYQVTAGASTANWSGTSSNSFAVAFYDVTNSAWLSQSANFGMTQSSGIGTCTGNFQTSLTTASVRMCVYAANATTGSGPTILFDDLQLGPQTVPIGMAAADMQAYTATWTGVGTVTNLNSGLMWGRQGQFMVIQGDVTLGTVTGTTWTMTLPNSLTANVSASSGNYQAVGRLVSNDSTASHVKDFVAITTNGSNVISFSYPEFSQAINTLSPQPGNSTITGAVVSIDIRLPIVGWSSNVQMSSDTDTRVISFQGSGTTQSVTANVTDIAATAITDRSGSWNGTQFKVPIAGDYVFNGSFVCSVAQTGAVYKNGTAVPNGNFTGQLSASTVGAGSILVCGCVPGDLLSMRASSSGTVSQLSIGIYRLSGPSVIANTESVNARYYSSSTAVSSSLATVMYSTKGWDTHNAYNATTGIYTAPVSGKYQVNASIAMTGTFVLNSILDLQVQQTGSNTQVSESKSFSGGAVTQMNTNVGDIFYMLAGDQLKVQASNSGTAPVIAATTTQNWVSVARIGN